MLLEIQSLTAGYGDIQILSKINLEVAAGQVVALVGANGAGKSTLLKTISGLIKPSAGKIFFNGQDITSFPAKEIVSSGIIQVPEGRRLFPEMTVEENLILGTFRRKKAIPLQNHLDEIYNFFPKLKERRKQKAGSLSGGEQQMCAIARGLMGDPRLLLIDEMSLGLAPFIVDNLIEIVKEINQHGTSVLLVEQDVQLALENADFGYILATGQIVGKGPTKDLLEDQEIKTLFLGL